MAPVKYSCHTYSRPGPLIPPTPHMLCSAQVPGISLTRFMLGMVGAPVCLLPGERGERPHPFPIKKEASAMLAHCLFRACLVRGLRNGLLVNVLRRCIRITLAGGNGPSMGGLIMAEHRIGKRQRTLKAAVVSFNEGHSTLPCRVRDLSANGCSVITDGVIDVPDTFQLYIELDGLTADCEVIWRGERQAGVRFVDEPQYSAPKRIQVVNAHRPDERPTLRRKGARIISA